MRRHDNGYSIFIFGDINDEVRDDKRVREFLLKSKQKNLMTTRFPDQELPSNYILEITHCKD